MEKSLFLAGASGAIGRRLAPLLVQSGWRVVGTTRSAAKAAMLREMGVEPVVVDVYDAAALHDCVAAARPSVVVHQLTDLPPALDPGRMAEALPRNARLRDEGTRNLVSAAVKGGARRLIAQSIAFVYAEGPLPHREDDPLALEHPQRGSTARGVASLEGQVLEAPLDGVVLRYGLLFGPGTGFDAPAGPGSVHVDAVAKVTAVAIETPVPSGIYNVAEDDGTVSVEKAKRILGWDPSWRLDRPGP